MEGPAVDDLLRLLLQVHMEGQLFLLGILVQSLDILEGDSAGRVGYKLV